MSLIPPVYVNAPVQEIYDRTLPDNVFRTLIQIRGLAYQTNYERTPPLTLEDLMALRGLDRSNIYRHLAHLRRKGYIRTELIGSCQFVIYPLRWEPGTALPTDADRQALTDVERAGLTGEPPSPGPSRKNATSSRKNANHYHVVVDHDSVSDEQQQHDLSRKNATPRASPENGTESGALLADLVTILVENGVDEQPARVLAGELLALKDGPAVVGRQLGAFESRCAQARASPRGLDNPIGLLVASIRGDWPLPPATAEKEKRRWYTDEEFELFFEHQEAEESPP